MSKKKISDTQSPGYFSVHTADIQQANILIDVDKTNNINEVGILVYNESLDEYHSIYYNCSMKTWEDYLEIPNS